MDELHASGATEDIIHAKQKELGQARDEKLKAIFSSEQMRKWQEEILPSLRAQSQIRQ